MLATAVLAGLAVVQGIDAPAAYAASALSCDQNTLYAVNADGQLSSINATTGAVASVASVDPGDNGLGIARGGTAAYAFTNNGNAITRYDALTGQVTTTTGVDTRDTQVLRGAINPVTGLYYYASGGTSAYTGAFDPAGPTKIGQVGTITGLVDGNGDFAFSSQGLLFIVAENEVRRIDDTTVPTTAGNQVLGTSLVATLPTGTKSPGVAFSSDGYLYVASGPNVLKLDPASGAVLATVALSGGYSPSDLGSCNYANTLSAATEVAGRWRATDQFSLAVTGGGIVSGNTAVTSGSVTGLQPVVAGAALTVPTKTYTATQTAAGTTDLRHYSTTYRCVNVNDSMTIASGSGNTASFVFPAAARADGTDVVCTFSNTVVAVRSAAVGDTASTPAGTAVSTTAATGVLANDAGTGRTVTGTTNPSSGTVTVRPDGSYLYSPNPGFSGTDSFTYTATDSAGTASSATVTLSVTPVAVADGGTTRAGSSLRVAAPGTLGNDLGAGLRVTGQTDPGHGSVAVAADGSYVYTPNAGYSGPDSFTYTLTDAAGKTASTTVALTVTPVATGDTLRTTAGGTVSLSAPGVLGDDSGTGITVTGHTAPTAGTVTLLADGSLTYIPAAGFSGVDTFAYTITDRAGSSTTAGVTITVGPVATADTATTPAGTIVTTTAATGVLSNDSGRGLTVTGNTDPVIGSAVVHADGSYVYAPKPGWSGTDSFTYTTRDSSGTSATGTVTIAVTPVAVRDAGTTTADTPVTIGAPGVLGDDVGTGITVTDHSAPAHGSVTVASDGSYVYTPAAGYSGPDAFGYEITDSAGGTSVATVELTVTPVAVDDIARTSAGTPVTVAAPGVLVNDLGTSLAVTGTTAPAHGTVTVRADGSLVYRPLAGFSGADTFDYTITDGAAQTATARVTLMVGSLAADDTASAVAGHTASATSATGVLANDTGTGLTVTGNTSPSAGSVTMAPDGSWIYTPAPGFSGPDTFTYTTTDRAGNRATGTVTITVVPVAIDDRGTTSAGTALRVTAPGVVGNDVGTGLAVTGHTAPRHGDVAIDADGSYDYTPADGYSGADTFAYAVTDAAGATTTATVRLIVVPVASDDAVSTTSGSAVSVERPGVLADDLGTRLSVTGHTAPANGIVSVDSDGSFTYTPASGFSGSDGFDYTVTDRDGGTDTASVTVAVGVLAVDDTGTTPAGTALRVDASAGILTNDSGVALAAAALTRPSDGRVSVSRDGSFVYIPDRGFAGTDTFSYRAADSAAGAATATVTITVTPVDAAIARPDQRVGKRGQSVSIDPLATDLPTAGHTFEPASLVLIDPVTGGTVLRVAAAGVGVWTVSEGAVVFTPTAGFEGTATIRYEITDTAGATVASTVTVGYPAVAVVAVLATTGAELPVVPLVVAALLAIAAGALALRRRRVAA
jgi:hypothetical protein